MFSIRFDKIKSTLVLLVALMLVTTVDAGLFGSAKVTDPRPVSEVFVLQTEALAGNKLLLRWDVLPDYYLYDQRMKFSAEDGVTITEISRSETVAKDDPLFGKVQVYYHSSEIMLQLANLPESNQVSLKIEYQGCWDGGVCYPPESQQRTVTMIGSQAIDTNIGQDPLAASLSNSAASNQIQGLASEHDYFSQLLSKGDLVWILSAFFVAGLALSLTPCVFPMIPILSSIIAGQGESVTKSRALLLTSIYILSVSFTYTAAGVLAGIFGENLQALFQATWIIVLFSAIFVLLALSMFGFYELQLPAALQSKLTLVSNKQRGGSFIGVAIMGVLSALIVGPCMAAPLAGALIYIGQSADPVLGGLALFSLSIGMGVPLLIVGVSAGHFMPKAGPWMNGGKASFGVLLIFMAIYMLDRIVPMQVTMLLSAATFIVSAIYLGALNSLQAKAANLRKLMKATGLIFLVYGLSLLVGALAGGTNMLQPLAGVVTNKSDDRAKNRFEKVTSLAQIAPLLAQAKAQGRPVMLDFYADWCISCVEIEYMFEERKVASVLENFYLIKVDLTEFNDEARALLAKYKVLGPPALVFYNKAGELESKMSILGLVGAERFVQHLQPLLR
ncbi:MAG: hypothetical protein OFPI_01530 [Osedax symbiont Rs2]|nr:MAG: hypothetical protein OFPI_01530 [Osedax symbiont Rs2]